jgi:hypothetical protein
MTAIASTLFIQRLVWASAMASLAVCAAFPALVESRSASGIGGHEPGFVGVILAASSIVAVAFVLWRTVRLAPVHEGRLSPRPEERAGHLVRTSLLVWTIAQAVGLYGLCLWLIVDEAAYLYGFLAMGTFLLAIHAPESPPLPPAPPRLAHPGRAAHHLLVAGRPSGR